jgi:hypothetical protein
MLRRRYLSILILSTLVAITGLAVLSWRLMVPPPGRHPATQSGHSAPAQKSPLLSSSRHVVSEPPPTSTNSATTSAHLPEPNDRSEIDLAVGADAVPVIVDPHGLRTGRTSATSSSLQEIPGSAYFEDLIGGQVNHYIQISAPKDGEYSIVLSAVNAGDYVLSVRAFSSDGSSQPELLRHGHLQENSHARFLLEFASAPGATSSLSE